MIEDLFKEREIFLTGGTGTVGKALIEKLLRSCEVGKIYILLRPKDNLLTEQRLEKLKKEMFFRQLRLQKPNELDTKLMAIPGDVFLPRLGITCEYQKVLENASIIFHCATTARLNANLKDALKLNVAGTWQTIKFAETLKCLEAFMHVSTFFSNPYLLRVEEKVYEAPMNWKVCLNLLNRRDISENQLEALTRKLIMGFPNTYCFTQNLAESLVNDYRAKLPVAIYRPSIILFALEEPETGLSSTKNGSMRLFAATGAGVLKTLFIAQNARLDLTPLDFAVKTLCYYTYKTCYLYKASQQLIQTPVFITSSCTHSDLTFAQYINIVQDYGFWTEAAFEKNFLIPGLHCTDKRSVYLVLVFVKQILPAILADFVLILTGHKPILLAINQKLFHTLETMKPFCFNTYESSGVTDITEIHVKLKGTSFNMDILPTGKRYYRNCKFCLPMLHSVREHLLKEDPKTLPRSRKLLKAKIFLYKATKLLLVLKLMQQLQEYIGHIYFEKILANQNSTFFCDI